MDAELGKGKELGKELADKVAQLLMKEKHIQ
jgi:hypothetical protein